MTAQNKQAETELSESLVETKSYGFDSGRKAREKQLELVSLLSPQNKLVLDAGCGPGTYGIIMAQMGNHVIGLDISLSAAEEARKRAVARGVDFAPLTGDLERLPFANNTFGVCFCAFALHHFSDFAPVIREMARVLKPGGKLVLLEPNGSNIMVKLSNRLENLSRGWLFNSGIDSPNEKIHNHKLYEAALRTQGFAEVKVASSYTGGLPPLPPRPQKSFGGFLNFVTIHFLARTRRLIYYVTAWVLPRPLNGIDLMITATKGHRE